MDRLKIPSTLALLGLSFTAACGPDEAGDPIVGKWNAIMAGDMKLPYVSDYGSISLDLVIKADHTGTYNLHQTISYEGQSEMYDYSYPLTVDDSMEPTYKITVEENGEPLVCVLSGTTLNCEDGELIFKK